MSASIGPSIGPTVIESLEREPGGSITTAQRSPSGLRRRLAHWRVETGAAVRPPRLVSMKYGGWSMEYEVEVEPREEGGAESSAGTWELAHSWAVRRRGGGS